MSKKQKKGYVTITLKKDGYNDAVIESCPQKIKLNFLQLYLAVGFGCPALNVKPIDWKGAGMIFATFLAPYIACAFFAAIGAVPLAIISLIGLFVVNIIITKNYFFNYIKKRIAQGYLPETEEQKNIIIAAGIHVPSSSVKQNDNLSAPVKSVQPQRDITQELEKIAGLKDKGILTQEEFEAQKQKLLNS